MGTIRADETEVEKLPDETIAAAQKVVASNATGADDCAYLLDLLGLGGPGAAICRRCKRGMSRLPSNGSSSRRGRGGICGACVALEVAEARRASLEGTAELIDVEDIRAVVERIKRDTGMTTKEVGIRAGVNTSSLTNALAPSSTAKHMQRSTYAALMLLAKELGA